DAGELDHQPLDDLVALGHVGGQEAAGFFGEIKQDRARLEHRIGLSAGALVVDDDGNLAVRIELFELRLVLLALPHVDGLDGVGEAKLLEQDEDLLHVRTGEGVKVDHRWEPRVLRQRHWYKAGGRSAIGTHRLRVPRTAGALTPSRASPDDGNR